MTLIALVSAGRGPVRSVGGVLAAAVMFILLAGWADAESWRDAVLLVIVAQVAAVASGFGGRWLVRQIFAGSHGWTTM